ncbi:RNA polymerase sigma factor [Paraburkholderia rhizosphaerae]|uniref:RNA polymerase sigma-70 factor (ECF subfamily) n=1 Tax=Paraburkholderia rhizosphaerae TaxID=480658 RepID=A0A4R8L5C3_9BURK|nr:RNA polymerase sigma factor [Paraburkholderia rhizosphaerae]TDY37771.1 RNA polymerase sigma-70 factor (ECF subfamily) [Paraburkholderia rhizosphaerae]
MLANTTELAGMLPDLLPRLWAFACRMTGDRLDAQALTQKTCLQARQRVGSTLQGIRPLCSIYAIAYRIWIDELRTPDVRARMRRARPLRWMQSADPQAALDHARAAQNQLIVTAVDQLPHAQRIAMLLVAIEALSYAEAAHVLGVPVNTVMSRVVRARQTIGRQFAAVADPCGKSAAR